MTLSIWRYSHLVLAIISFIFLALASGTGIILGIDAAKSPLPPYSSKSIDSISLTTLMTKLKSNYMELNSLEVEDHQLISIKGLDHDGNEISNYINPLNGEKIAVHTEKSSFIQSVTSLHRSLFLHELGRAFIGITSFLLALITVSGIALVVKQQKGIKRFFSSFSKEYFSQYYHVILGRISLIPILIIALSGTYLSLIRFNILPEKKIELKTPKNAEEQEQQDFSTFPLFKQIHLNQIRSIDFPFADDPDEYYKIKLKDRELIVNQFNGKIIQQQKYPLVNIINTISLNLHTGKTNTIWAIVLTIASAFIFFFIYTGFVITFRRLRNKIKNKYSAAESNILIFVGTENGGTIHFANKILQQLITQGVKAHVAELNNFKTYTNTQHVVIMTATFGLGDPPNNADNFLNIIEDYQPIENVHYSIVGFGSTYYPDFCGYAQKVDTALKQKEWAIAETPLHKVDDKSLSDFTEWVINWSDVIHLPLISSPNYYEIVEKRKLLSFIVVEKTEVHANDQTFIITLQSEKRIKFRSGDLFAIYPENNEKERLYSIGKIGKNIQLVVRLHPNGLGSSYLYSLHNGDKINAAIQHNHGFHFDKNNSKTIMISNGTGIAPFLGMIEENKKKNPIILYAGFRQKLQVQSFVIHHLEKMKETQNLSQYNIAYSRENQAQKYVYELLENDISIIEEMLNDGATLMICGSLSMHNDVSAHLQRLCPYYADYVSNNQIKSDCY